MENKKENIKKKRKLKKQWIFIFGFIIFVLCLLIYLLIFKNSDVESSTIVPNVVVIVNEIEGYDYSLSDQDTKYIEQLFHELEDVLLNISAEEYNEEDYLILVSKLFIADLFTLDNKTSNVDVGGLSYVDPLIRENFSLKVSDSLYKYIELEWGGDSGQVLPIVSNVEIIGISTEVLSYFDDIYIDELAYVVELSWSYEEDLGYQDSAILKFVHNDHKLDLIEISEN